MGSITLKVELGIRRGNECFSERHSLVDFVL